MPETSAGRKRILDYMNKHNISRSQLAVMYGMNKQDVADFLAGRRVNPAANRFIIKLIQDFGIQYEKE